MIFASGYYTPDPNAEPPAWKDADPHEYTVTYVENAIARCDRDGLEVMKHYYKSVASFDGQWYMFTVDANDLYNVHPVFPHLIGTDIKDVVDTDGYELGEEIAQGHGGRALGQVSLTASLLLAGCSDRSLMWCRHARAHPPVGLLPGGRASWVYTLAYEAEAIAYYDREGLEATVAYYNSPESVDGQSFLNMVDADSTLLTSPLFPNQT